MLTDPDTGQTLLSGQGELHLEIVADRLKTEFNVEPVMGPVVISYREALLQSTANSRNKNRTNHWDIKNILYS